MPLPVDLALREHGRFLGLPRPVTPAELGCAGPGEEGGRGFVAMVRAMQHDGLLLLIEDPARPGVLLLCKPQGPPPGWLDERRRRAAAEAAEGAAVDGAADAAAEPTERRRHGEGRRRRRHGEGEPSEQPSPAATGETDERPERRRRHRGSRPEGEEPASADRERRRHRHREGGEGGDEPASGERKHRSGGRRRRPRESPSDAPELPDP